MSALLRKLADLHDLIETLKVANELLVGQYREQLQLAARRDAAHEVDRQRWHADMVIVRAHLYRLIEEKRQWESKQASRASTIASESSRRRFGVL